MPAIYHSGCRSKQRIANIAKLTFRTKINGPIKTLDPEHLRKEDPVGLDIIDETFYYFKSNLFFNQYEIMSESDRNLIYITLFILECLKMISKSGFNRRQAQQDLFSLSQQKFALPGDARFPLNQMYSKPKTVAEEEELRAYLLQVRQECSLRLLDLVWPKEERQPSKWWMCFSKRKFMNITLNEVQAY